MLSQNAGSGRIAGGQARGVNATLLYLNMNSVRTVLAFCSKGFLPSAMKNYLSLLGWNDGTEKEIFTEEELFEAFDLRRVVKSSAVFDMTKLK